MNIDDPKLTAFALDELAEPERSRIAREVAKSPESQRYVEETRELALSLKKEFAAEIANEKPASNLVRRNLSDIRDDPWFWGIGRPLAVAAGIAIFAVLGTITIATYNSRHNSISSPSVDSVIEGEEKPQAQALPEFATPNFVANPLRADAIKRIERVVIGETVDRQSENGELRVVDVINDGYRVQRLRQRLSIPVVSKKSYRGLPAHGYELIFLDGIGDVVASAHFYRVPNLGFVLQPQKNAYRRNGRYFVGGDALLPGDWRSDIDYRDYVIEFPDWSECIGYSPGA